jgi:hypothetical protein
MIIHVKKRDNPYAQIDKRALNDDRLSYKARGLLAYLLSKPPDWQVWVRDLINRSQKDGETAVRSALKELKEWGYMQEHQSRMEDGTFGPVEYWIYEEPLGGFPQADKPHAVEPKAEKPQAENQGHTNNDSTENQSTDNEEEKEEPVFPENPDDAQPDDQAVIDSIADDFLNNTSPEDLARRTAEARAQAGNYAVTAHAGGDDQFHDGPVDAFCEVLAAILPAQLPQGKRRSWGNKLHEIAKEWSTDDLVITPAIMEASIRAIPDDSEIGWKSFSSPYSDNFDQNVGPLLLRNGQPRQKKSSGVPDPDRFDRATAMTRERLKHGNR